MDYSTKLVLYIILYIILMITTILTAVWFLRIIKMKLRSKNYLVEIKQYKINGDLLAMVIWLLLSFVSLRTYMRTDDYMWKVVIIVSLYCCLFYLYRAIVDTKITEDGIYLKENFIKWNEINDYKWTGFDFLTLKFEIENKVLFIRHKVIYKLFLDIKEKNLVEDLINKDRNKHL
ncbi:MAG: hypothetical protein ABF289_12585 [Clostridiales bacterium]